ncbi:MAG: class I SAM-dependent methyltransferase [Clostridia bacterium]|nr:class I SAM-dependent methyltransferase [Clostridia bacterium]
MTAEQYYTKDPTCASNEVTCAFVYRGHGMMFTTDAGVFSKGELDPGSRLLMDALPALSGDVLDLGCGWGPIGISVAKANKDARVVMADVNHRALDLTRRNAAALGASVEVLESDGMSALLDREFDAVITNPPIRAGKQVIYQMFADSARVLRENGALYLVIRKQQGAESCMKYLKTLFANVEKLDKSAGYWVLKASGPVKQGENTDAV